MKQQNQEWCRGDPKAQKELEEQRRPEEETRQVEARNQNTITRIKKRIQKTINHNYEGGKNLRLNQSQMKQEGRLKF